MSDYEKQQDLEWTLAQPISGYSPNATQSASYKKLINSTKGLTGFGFTGAKESVAFADSQEGIPNFNGIVILPNGTIQDQRIKDTKSWWQKVGDVGVPAIIAAGAAAATGGTSAAGLGAYASAAAGGMASASMKGATGEEIVGAGLLGAAGGALSPYLTSLGLSQAVSSGITSAITSGISTKMNGGSWEDTLASALASYLTSYLGKPVSSTDAIVKSAANMAIKAGASYAQGGDFNSALKNGIIAGASYYAKNTGNDLLSNDISSDSTSTGFDTALDTIGEGYATPEQDPYDIYLDTINEGYTEDQGGTDMSGVSLSEDYEDMPYWIDETGEVGGGYGDTSSTDNGYTDESGDWSVYTGDTGSTGTSDTSSNAGLLDWLTKATGLSVSSLIKLIPSLATVAAGVGQVVSGENEGKTVATNTTTSTLPSYVQQSSEDIWNQYVNDFYGLKSREETTAAEKKAADDAYLKEATSAWSPYQSKLAEITKQQETGTGYYTPVSFGFGGKKMTSFVPKMNKATAQEYLSTGKEASTVGAGLAELKNTLAKSNLSTSAADAYSEKLKELMKYVTGGTSKTTESATTPGQSDWATILNSISQGADIYKKLASSGL